MSRSADQAPPRKVDNSVDFKILGPITVVEGDNRLNVGGLKQRTVLAMLIAHGGLPVSNDVIAQAVYGDDASGRGRRRVQTYVSTLRSIFGDRISKDGSGWALRMDRSEVDALRFEDMYESVRGSQEMAPEVATKILREALALWRGHPYVDIEAHGLLDSELARLSELRLVVQAARIDADLASGRDADLIGEIEGLIAEHPYLERLRAQHMLALYRAGRQREALSSYSQLRSLLINELGVDPTPDLQSLEQRILEQDNTLDVSPRRVIQKKAVLVADPGDPIELARLPRAERESLLSSTNRALERAIEGEPGGVLLHAGTASYAVFDSIGAAVSAAEAITRQLESPGVRMAIDYGDVELSERAVSGAPVSRAAVLVAVAYRGQALLSLDAHQALVLGGDGTGLRFESLGRFDLAGIKDPLSIHQLLVGDPPTSFPPLDTGRVPPALPDGGDRSLPGYELREALGPGSIGTLYRAYQPSVGREVMVEVIGRYESSARNFIRNFEADAQRLTLLDHPNINPLLDYWRDTEGAFLVYRHHRGGSLVSEAPADPDRLLAQVGSALEYAHSYGVLHGSVRPDRVVLDESGNGYLMGFPIAGIVAPPSPRHSTYVAPESLAGEPPSVATDVFALGVLARELFTAAASEDETSPAGSHVVARAASEDPSDRHTTVAEFLTELTPARPARQTRLTVTRNPYKGLSAFHESDAGDFHGRSQVVEELVDSLGRSRFLAVVGPSGIGKSSVVRAGLIPALRLGAVPGSDSWVITDMLPGSHPFFDLQRALERVAVDISPDLRERFAKRDRNCLAELDRALPADSELLLVIDQFEELFTMTDQRTAAAFLDLLSTAVQQHQAWVVITLRADFLDRPLLYSEFGELLGDNMVTLRSPNPAELGDAIVRPAAGVGVEIDGAVAERMISEVHDRPGALPLLQHTLVELFESRTSDLVSLDAFEEIGGVTGSLAKRAEDSYSSLEPSQRTALKQVFLRLVTVVDDAAPTRRRVVLSSLEELDGQAGIEAFARSRMLVFDNDPDTRAPTVEVAHEALLTHWPRLAGWIDATRQDLTLSRRLDDAIRDWEANDRNPTYLLAGGRLAQHQAWTTATSLVLTKQAHGFLDESVSRDEELMALGRRRRRLIMTGFATAATVATLLAVAAWVQRGQAQESAQVAEARELILEAEKVLQTDPELSVMLALQAIDDFGADAVPPSAASVLRRALTAQRVVQRLPGGQLVAVSPNGATLVTGGDNEEIAIWNIADVATPAMVSTISRDDSLRPVHAWYIGNANELAVVYEDPVSFTLHLRLFDMGTRAWDRFGLDIGEQAWVEDNPAGDLFAVWDDGALTVSDRTTNAVIYAAGNLVEFGAVAFSGDSRLAYGVIDEDGLPGFEIVDPRTSEPHQTISGLENEPVFAEFSPDGSKLAYTTENFVAVVDVESGVELWGNPNIDRNDEPVWLLDGSQFLVGGGNELKLFDALNGEIVERVPGNRGGNLWYHPVPGTSLVAAAGSEDTLLIDLSPGGFTETELQFESPFPAAVSSRISPNGEVMFLNTPTAFALVEVGSGEILLHHESTPADYPIPAGFAVAGHNGAFVAGYDQDDGVYRVWSTLDVSEVYTAPDDWGIRAVSGDGSMVAITRKDGMSQLVSTTDGSVIMSLEPGFDLFNAFFSTDGAYVLTNNRRAQAPFNRIWNIDSGLMVNGFGSDEGSIGGGLRVEFTDDDETLIFGQFDGTVVVFDFSELSMGVAPEDAEITRFAAHNNLIASARLSADGSTLATNGRDEPVKLWAIETGEPLGEFGEGGVLPAMAWDPSETRLYVAEGGTVSVHTLDLDEVIGIAQDRLTRAMTEEECQRYFRHPCEEE